MIDILLLACAAKKRLKRKPFLKASVIILGLFVSIFLLSMLPKPAMAQTATYNAARDCIEIGGSGAMNLTDVYTDIGNPAIINRTGTVFDLNASVDIGSASIQFFINSTDCTELHIISYPTLQRRFEWRSDLYIQDCNVYGYESGAVDTTPANRSIIRSEDGLSAGEFYAENVTFAYLGNGTISSLIEGQTGLRVIIYTGSAHNATVDGCTFHNMSSIYFHGAMLNLTIANSNFYDPYNNYTMLIKWPLHTLIKNCLFSNASEFQINDCYDASTTRTLENVTFENQWNDNHYVFELERCSNTYFYDVTVNNCKNNSVLIDWNTNNTWFENFYMNYTGRAIYTGFWARASLPRSHNLTVKDSVFESVNDIEFKWLSRSEFDNVTVYGNHLGAWQNGIYGGNYSYIHDCHVYNVSWAGIQAHSHSIIENNYIEETDNGILVYAGNIYTYNPIVNQTITGNTVYNTTYNLDYWDCGVRVANAPNGTTSDILIENNNITGGSFGVLIHGNISDVTVRNNNISSMPWGTGRGYLPYNYTRPIGVGGLQNQSDRRIITGVGVIRYLGGSWNWTVTQTTRYNNITIEDNSFNGTYLQAYLQIDKIENASGIDRVNVGALSENYTRFEFTDSFYNGTILYVNPDNPIYRYSQSNMYGVIGNTSWTIGLNTTHFETTVPVEAATNIDWAFYFSPLNASFIHNQTNNNVTHYYRLHTIAANESSACRYFDAQGAVVLNQTAPANNVTYWRVASGLLGRPTVQINGVADTSHWRYASATNTSTLWWTFSSEVDVQLNFAYLPFPPTNVDVVITNMEGCGNWVFAEEIYYNFQADYADPNGYEELDTMKIRFTDGFHNITARYDGSDFELESMSYEFMPVRIKDGTAMAINSQTLRVVFKIYFTSYVLDILNTSISMWCNDTTGITDTWEVVTTDYFCIYSLGGHSVLTTNGTNAGRMIGGDVFDLYSYNNSWAEATMIFRHLQHVKILPIIQFIDYPAAEGDAGLKIKYFIEYCIGDDWIEGFAIELVNVSAPWGEISSNYVFINWTCNIYRAGSLLTSKQVYSYVSMTTAPARNITFRLWFDLWFNKVNASSTFGVRANAYYFPMKNNAHPWFLWLTGANWGIDDTKGKQAMFFGDLFNVNSNITHTQNINLVRIGCNLTTMHDGVAVFWAQLSDYDVFDLTIGQAPFRGIPTPVFDETKVPIMPQGGFLGAVVSAINSLVELLRFSIGFAALVYFEQLVGFLDSIAAYFGYPGLFSTLISWVTSFATWMVASVTYLVSMLGLIFTTVLGPTMGKFLTVITSVFTTWMSMLSTLFNFLNGAYTGGFHVWEELGMSNWIIIAALFYPLYLLFVWEKRGIDAVLTQLLFIKDIVFTLVHFFVTIASWFINLIGRIIESIPIVE